MFTPTVDGYVVGTLIPTNDPFANPRSTFARYGLTTLDVLLSFAVLVVMCAYTPFFHTWFWAPRMAVVLTAVIPGSLALGLLAVRRDRTARVAAAFLGWALVAAAFSDNWWLSFRGTIVQSTFVLSYMAAFGLWALAQSLTRSGRRLMMWVVLVGVGLNAAAGAAQMLFQLEGGNLGLSGGRAVGLTPNPIELAAFMLIGLFVCLQLYTTSPARWKLPLLVALVAFGAVLAFTATRIALIAFAVVSLGNLVANRDRRKATSTAAAALGVVGGIAIARIFSDGTDVLARAGASDGGRTDWWVAGWNAFIDRPFVGWGAGRFRSAIQGELSFAHIAANQDSQAIPDAHNIFVSMTVDFGIVGLVLFLAFCWMVARRVSGVYSLALIAVPIVWLLQPVAQTTMLLYVILLGIAVSAGQGADGPSQGGLDIGVVRPWIWAAATVIGVSAASWLLVAEYRLSQASLDLDGKAFTAAEAMYFGDPIVSDVGARIWAGRAMFDPSAEQRILPQLERSAELEPTRAYFHAKVASELARLGNYGEAELRARRALGLQPTSSLAWGTLMNVAEQRNDDELRNEAAVALCALGLDLCGP